MEGGSGSTYGSRSHYYNTYYKIYLFSKLWKYLKYVFYLYYIKTRWYEDMA